MIKYKMNLVKSIRIAERRSVKHRVNLVLLIMACFGILGGAGYYTYDQVVKMQREITRERQKLRRLEAEYRNYQAEQTVIDKSDIELLNELLSKRVYWTRILEAMTKYLPEKEPISYWITKFGFSERSGTFTVQGFGYITEAQEQLLELDEYLNNLRADPNYSEVFGQTFLRSTVRQDEEDGAARELRERINFEYASLRKGTARR
ncbi:MAG: hypothetical protein LBC70_03815 [Chitinispirillales bacterium]|jgi:cell division protein FtsB|nr:hypothetical protein [Chitinispirillales bacterium]